jgi:signal recognition particle subunit SEC65
LHQDKKTPKNKEKKNILVEQEKNSNVFELILVIHSYMKLRHEQLCNAT